MVTRAADSGQPPFGGRAVRALVVVALVALLLAGAVPDRGSVTAAAAATTTRTAAVATGSYELVSGTAAHRPFRWLACRPIEYRINRAGMPAGLDRTIAAVMTGIGAQTGARFRYAGTTRRTFGSTARPSTPTIYFSFTAKHRAYGHVFGYPGEIGVGGPTGAYSEDGDGHRYEAVTSGRVLLSTAFTGRRTGPGATWESLIRHEVGHALNLAHRKAAGDVMNPMLTASAPARFRPAEVAALRRELQRTGCDYTAWSRL